MCAMCVLYLCCLRCMFAICVIHVIYSYPYFSAILFWKTCSNFSPLSLDHSVFFPYSDHLALSFNNQHNSQSSSSSATFLCTIMSNVISFSSSSATFLCTIMSNVISFLTGFCIFETKMYSSFLLLFHITL